jgi:hypothetical protein
LFLNDHFLWISFGKIKLFFIWTLPFKTTMEHSLTIWVTVVKSNGKWLIILIQNKLEALGYALDKAYFLSLTGLQCDLSFILVEDAFQFHLTVVYPPFGLHDLGPDVCVVFLLLGTGVDFVLYVYICYVHVFVFNIRKLWQTLAVWFSIHAIGMHSVIMRDKPRHFIRNKIIWNECGSPKLLFRLLCSSCFKLLRVRPSLNVERLVSW